MKLTNFKSIALLALAGSTLLTANARAGAIASATGDLFLGVRANGGTGLTTEVVVDLGSAADVTRANQTVSIPGLDSALSSAFGADWASRTDLAVGVVGTSGNPTYSLYASKTSGTPWASASLTAQAVTGNKVNSMMGTYAAASGGVSTPITRSTGTSGSWSSFAKISSVSPFNPLAFGAFTAAFEGTPGQALELYKIDVGTATKDLGGLTLNSDGTVTYATPSANAANSTISFSDIYVRAPKGATSVTLNLVRTGGTNPATAVVTLNGNTATAAFGTGAKFTSVTMALAPSSTVAGTKSTATLSTGVDTTGATTVTASGSATVYAAGYDSSIPALALTAPTATALVTGLAGVTAGNLTITGSADSSFGIDDVAYSINGGAFTSLSTTLSAVATTPNKRTFTAPLTGVLTIAGVNKVVVRALSVNGQINTVTRLVRFAAAPAKGNIAVTAVDSLNAAVTFTAPAAFIGALPTSAAGAFTVGNTYAITAPLFNSGVTAATTDNSSLMFSYWTIGSSATAVSSLSTTFVASADIIANGIKAHYIANPFQSAAGAAATLAASGTYSGLIKAATGFTASNDTTGLINVTLSSRGALSGNIKIHTNTYTFVSGSLASDGTVLFGVAPNQVPFTSFNPGGTTVVLKFDLVAKTLSGQLYTSTNLSDISAKLQSVATAATYTFHAPAPAVLPVGLTVDTFAQGDTIGSFALNTNSAGTNVVSGTINLGDSKMATFSAFYTGTGVIPLYVSPYGATVSTAGSYSGLLTVSGGNVSGTCTWFRPASVAASAYTAGWPAGVATTVAGGTFDNLAASLFTGVLASGNVTTFDKTGTGLSVNPAIAGGVDIAAGVAPAYTFKKAGTAIVFGTYSSATGFLIGTAPFASKSVVIQNGATPGFYGYFSTLATSPAGIKQGLFTIHP